MITRDLAIRHGRTLQTQSRCPACRRTVYLPAKLKQEAERNLGIHRSRRQLRLSVVEPRVVPTYKKALERWSAGVAVSAKTKMDVANHHREMFGGLGTSVEPTRTPQTIIMNPPGPGDVTLEHLMTAQTHLGHATSLWNPMNQRYIYGIRQGIHIISLEITAAHLRRAARVVEGVAYHGGLILFVGNKKHRWSVVRAATNAKACFLYTKWTPGTITNRQMVLTPLELKVLDSTDSPLPGYDEALQDWPGVVPDLVVMSNTRENHALCHELGQNNIPTIGIIDTNVNPTWVTYPIPANDDSQQSVNLILGVLGRAGAEGQRNRLIAAKNGKTTWKSTPYLGAPKRSNKELEQETKEEAKSLVIEQDDSQVRGASERPEDLFDLKKRVVVRKSGGPYVNVLGDDDLWEPYDEEKDKHLDKEVEQAEKDIPRILKRLTELDSEFEDSYQEYLTGETTKASKEKMRKLMEEDMDDDKEDENEDDGYDEEDEDDDRPHRGPR